MFTGIIQARGKLCARHQIETGLILEVDISALQNNEIRLGDSIAVNGACLTVKQLQNRIAHFDVSGETLNKCLMADWQEGFLLNLEAALTLNTPLGGHLVSGHVDGIVSLVSIVEHSDFIEMTFQTSLMIGKYIAVKGSVAINGVSLTSNTVTDYGDMSEFRVMLVPHTLKNTSLGDAKVGDKMHIEIDQVARYVERLNSINPIQLDVNS